MPVKLNFNEINGDKKITINLIAAIMNGNEVTLLEDAVYFSESLNYRPKYEELQNRIEITYEWEKNPIVKLRLVYTQRPSVAGFSKVSISGNLMRNNTIAGVYAGMQYDNPVWIGGGTTENTYTGQQIICYDTKNKLLFSFAPIYATWVDGYFETGEDFYRYNNILITPKPLKKGHYIPNGIYVGSQKITASNQKLTVPIGSTVSHLGYFYNNKPYAPDYFDQIFNYISIPSYPNQNPDDDNGSDGQPGSDTPLPGDGDTSSDPIPNPPRLPVFDITNTGFVVIYNPSVTEIRQLASFMWSGEFVDLIKKMFAEPFAALISLKMLFCPITTGGSQTVWLGNVETTVSMSKVTQQFTDVDMGSIIINEFFGSFADYAPFTKIQIFLPFIGYKDLNVDEVMNSTLHIRYRVDVYSGACIAFLTITKSIKSTNLNSILYQFDGNCAIEFPFTSNDNSRYVAAILNSAASSALSLAATSGFTTPIPPKGFDKGEPSHFELGSLAPVANGMLDILSVKPNVQRAGSLAGAVAAMGLKQPYIIIHRPIQHMPANYQHFLGIPLNLSRQLSNITGYTIVSQLFFSSSTATDTEIAMITALLKQGVIL